MRLALAYFQMISTGGVERYLLGFIRQLMAAGHEVELVTARTDGAVESLGLRVERVALGRVPRALQLRRFSRAVEAYRARAGADFVLGFGRTVSQDVHRAGGGCHQLYSRLLPPWKRWGLKNHVELALERQLYTGGQTRHFVVNARPVADQLSTVWGVAPERLTVIHSAVDSQHFRPLEENHHSAPSSGPPIILFVSSHHRRKGLDALLGALAEIPGPELRIAGAPLDLRYTAMIRRLDLGSRVRYLGWLDDPADAFRDATLFVDPTRYDACANSVLQAMASGLTCVVSSADGASEFITPGETGLLIDEPIDAAAVQRALSIALGLDPATRHRLGTAARARVLPLTWNAHLRRWIDLLERLGPAR